MKKYIIILLAMLGFTACMNDFSDETVGTGIFTAEGIGEPNTTIAEVRTKYAKAIESGATTEMAVVDEDLIIEGIVTGNDISGNIYQAIFLQDINADGTCDNTRGGLQVSIKGIGSLAALFPAGQRVRINMKGLCMSGYGKMPRLGLPYVNTNGALRHGPMPASYVKTNVQLVGTPDTSKVTPHELTSAELKSSTAIDELTPMLVVIRNCTIDDAKYKDDPARCRYAHVDYTYEDDEEKTYSVEHSITLADGYIAKSLLYTSTSATFAQEQMPEGKADVTGILGRYTSSFQLSLRSKEDVTPITQ